MADEPTPDDERQGIITLTEGEPEPQKKSDWILWLSLLYGAYRVLS